MGRLPTLRKGEEFDRVYREGTVWNGPLFVLRALPNGTDGTRWGIAVGKRLSKRAVERNRLRRQVREILRQTALRPGYDIVVTAKQPSLGARYRDLSDALHRQLRRAKLLQASEEDAGR